LWAAVVVLVAFGVALPLVDKGPSPTAGSARAVLQSAVTSTLGKTTAHITMSGTTNVEGHTATVTGSGELDFAAHSVEVQVGSTVAGHQTTVQEIFDGTTLYLDVPGLSSLAPGKSWVSVNLSSTATSNGLTSFGTVSNPTSFLALLQQEGATVRSLGPSTQGGTQVQGYQVTLDKNAIESELSKEAANLPAWLRSAVGSVGFNGLDATVYVDSAGLLRSEAVSFSMSIGGASTSVDETLTFSTYGAPVTIEPPPSASVVTFEQIAQRLSAGSGTTA